MIVSSFGTLQRFGPELAPAPIHEGGLDSWSARTYAELYRTQPQVRTVIDFLARNVAQIGLHAFRRISDLDRVRLADHQVIRWLSNPNPSTTRYRLMEALMQDLGIYYSAYWLKLRRVDDDLGLVRLDPATVTVVGWLLPHHFLWTLPDGSEVTLAPDQVAYFTGYDPANPLQGLSPLETLRRLLAEDEAANAYRRAYWQNSARFEGIIERPAGEKAYSPAYKQAWREQWGARYTGRPGQITMLEPGEVFKTVSHNAHDSELTVSRKLTREEVAAAYHVPLPMVGILDHATFSNIREQHKNLYQDCLQPWLEMIQTELERQLLPEARDVENVYFEFNIADKMKGSFEETTTSLQRAVGRPFMTPNEARARLNLPRVTDDPTADQLAMPLNTSTGALALPPGPDEQEPAA